jgi:hypothetical protein
MPDLITHACVGYFASVLFKNKWHTPVVVGAILPDVLSRVPSMVFAFLRTHLSFIPIDLLYIWSPLHFPVGVLLSSLIFAMLWEPEKRRHFFGACLLGQISHLLIDLGQHHISGGYPLGFPVWNTPIEFGLYGTEASIWIAPILLIAVWSHLKLR